VSPPLKSPLNHHCSIDYAVSDTVPATFLEGIGATGLKSLLPLLPLPPIIKVLSKETEHSEPEPPADLPRFETLGEIVPPEDLPLEELYSFIIDNGLDFQGPNLRNVATPKVLVIGGGCAGLSAAFELKRAGADVILLESSEVCHLFQSCALGSFLSARVVACGGSDQDIRVVHIFFWLIR
jgi:hypothetical protein